MSFQNYLIKVKHILPAFLLTSLLSTITLALLRYLFIQLNIWEINEEIWTIWLSMGIPWIPMLLWLRKKLKILVFRRETDRRRFIFYMIAWLTMSGMNICTQMYITTATGKLEIINNPTEIGKKEKAHYYDIKEFFIPQGIGCYFIDRTVSGKYGQNLNYTAYFAIPMFKSPTAPAGNPKVWCCIKFNKRISNRLSDTEKEKEYKFFEEESKTNATKHDFRTITYFTLIPPSDRKDGYMNAIANMIKHYSNDEHIMLEPNTTSYEERNGEKLPWMFGIFAIGTTILMLLLTWPRVSMVQVKKQEYKETSKRSK